MISICLYCSHPATESPVRQKQKSERKRVFKEVCSNRGVTALQISETVGIAKEEALEILLELANVNGLIYYSMAFEDEYTANWYKCV